MTATFAPTATITSPATVAGVSNETLRLFTLADTPASPEDSRRKLTLRLEHDQDTESPCEYDGWKLYSFHRRSGDDPGQFIEYVERGTGKIHWASIGVQRKIACGTAFVLSCYEHGQVQWALQGEAHSCRWDTADIAGVLVWEGDIKDLPKGYDGRQKDARAFLGTYTAWANGDCYYYSLEDEDGETIDSCGGFIGSDHARESIKDQIAWYLGKEGLTPGDIALTLEGDAAYGADADDFLPAPQALAA